MKHPKVSVIIPAYNSDKYIGQCLESVLNQSLKNIEIICVNNGSTDKSEQVINSFKKTDPRINIINTPKSNAGAARNIGLAQAKGEYLSFIDSDDFCEPKMLETAYELANKKNLDIAIYEFNYFDNLSKTFSQYPFKISNHIPNTIFSPKEISTTLFNSFQNCPWNKIFKKSFILDNDIKFQEIERTNDLYFTATALSLAKRLSIIRQPLINYRINNQDSLQGTSQQSPLCPWLAFRSLKNRLIKDGNYKTYEQSFLNELLKNIFYNLDKLPENSDAFLYLFNILRYGAEIEFIHV